MPDLLSHTLVSAHNPRSGRLDALRLAHTLALSTPQMARIVGYTPAGLRKNPSSERLQGKHRELVLEDGQGDAVELLVYAMETGQLL